MTRYLLPDDLRDAVRIAVAIHRPLLVLGSPGTGKSTVARFVAASWGWTYAEEVVTSRTAARDLFWRFDAVRRLGDAHLGTPREPAAYVEPRALWWAFAPASAAAQVKRATPPPSPTASSAAPHRAASREVGPRRVDAPAPGSTPLPEVPKTPKGTVVLVDEIDKADPDVPNDLLGPLAERCFQVDETGERVEAEAVSQLLVITSNRERDLPLAFVRRCVVVTLAEPDAGRLVEIAALHGHLENEVVAWAQRFVAEREAFTERRLSTAEFLDALAARRLLGDAGWARILELVLKKTGATA